MSYSARVATFSFFFFLGQDAGKPPLKLDHLLHFCLEFLVLSLIPGELLLPGSDVRRALLQGPLQLLNLSLCISESNLGVLSLPCACFEGRQLAFVGFILCEAEYRRKKKERKKKK